MEGSGQICLCPLKYFKECDYIINEIENIKEIYTKYFLVSRKNKILSHTLESIKKG